MFLEGRNLFKKYSKKNILSGINIKIEPDKIILIKGKSGAGKSTLLYLLSFIERFDSGEILINNKKITSEVEKDRIKSRYFGFMFQDFFLLEDETGLSNILLSCKISKKNKSEERIYSYANSLFKETEILKKKVRILSGGERARIAFLRCIVHDPEICFFDEPTGNLDIFHADLIKKTMLRIKKERGLSYVIVSHNNFFDDIANEVYLLKDGKLEKSN